MRNDGAAPTGREHTDPDETRTVAHYTGDMARRPVTVNLDTHLLDTLARAAAEDGVDSDEVVEEALRRYFGLRGLAMLDEIGRRQAETGVSLDEDEAMELAVAELRAYRAERAQQRHAG